MSIAQFPSPIFQYFPAGLEFLYAGFFGIAGFHDFFKVIIDILHELLSKYFFAFFQFFMKFLGFLFKFLSQISKHISYGSSQ